jgi:hypothetical protein
LIEVSEIVLQEANLPDLVVDLADAHQLLGQRDTQIDFATTEADVAAARSSRGLHAAFTLMGPEFMRAEPSWQPRPAQ